MPTVVDSLVVQLGLDPKEFRKGAGDAEKSVQSMRRTVHEGTADMATGIRRVIGEFVGLFLAVRGIGDLVHMFADLNHSIAQLGYESTALDQSATRLRTWQQTAQQFGGTAGEVGSAINALQHSLFQMRFAPEFDPLLRTLRRIGVQLHQNADGAIDFDDAMMQLARRLQSMPKADRAQYLQNLGIFGPGLTNALLAGPGQLQAMLARERASASRNAAETSAAQQMERSWNDFKFQLTAIGVQLLKHLEPILIDLFRHINQWLGSHQKGIATALDKLDEWARGDGPDQIVDAMTAIGAALADLAHFIEWMIPEKNKASFSLFSGKPIDPLGDKFKAWRESNARRRAEKDAGLPVGMLDRIPPGAAPGEAANALVELHARMGGDAGDPDWSKTLAEFQKRIRPVAPSVPAPATPGAIGKAATAPPIAAAGAAPGTRSVSVSIGEINIHTQADDARGIATDIAQSTRQKISVALADPGLA